MRIRSNTNNIIPLIPSARKLSGEDYWISPNDLEREQQRLHNKRSNMLYSNDNHYQPNNNDDNNINTKNSNTNSSNIKNVISQHKLWEEVKAPYQQNWIGYFSLLVGILSIIMSQFPELLEPIPTIQYPDL